MYSSFLCTLLCVCVYTCVQVLEHYLEEVHQLHSELSISTRLVVPTPALMALAAAAATNNPLTAGACAVYYVL